MSSLYLDGQRGWNRRLCAGTGAQAMEQPLYGIQTARAPRANGRPSGAVGGRRGCCREVAHFGQAAVLGLVAHCRDVAAVKGLRRGRVGQVVSIGRRRPDDVVGVDADDGAVRRRREELVARSVVHAEGQRRRVTLREVVARCEVPRGILRRVGDLVADQGSDVGGPSPHKVVVAVGQYDGGVAGDGRRAVTVLCTVGVVCAKAARAGHTAVAKLGLGQEYRACRAVLTYAILGARTIVVAHHFDGRVIARATVCAVCTVVADRREQAAKPSVAALCVTGHECPAGVRTLRGVAAGIVIEATPVLRAVWGEGAEVDIHWGWRRRRRRRRRWRRWRWRRWRRRRG